MNLLTQAIENLYKHGMFILKFNNGDSCDITFFVDENGKLRIHVDHFYESFTNKYDLDEENFLPEIALLAYYSLFSTIRTKERVILTSDLSKTADIQKVMPAINELYRYFLPLISLSRRHVESIAKSDCNYSAFVNSADTRNMDCSDLSIKEIVRNLSQQYDAFSYAIYETINLWRKVVEGKNIDALNNFNDFLNKLYIAEFNNPALIDLNAIDIDYEFLDSKSYVTNPAIDREQEIENLEVALLTQSKSAMLVGPAGVGKNAVVEGLAYRISKGDVPSALKGKRILKINTSSIVRGCTLVGMFEEKVEKIMKYLIQNPNTILFIDEVHTAIGAGTGSNDSLDLANIMKPYLDRGEVKVIGATTIEEYDSHIKKDNAYKRRYLRVDVSEPQIESTCKIIDEVIKKLQLQTGITWNLDDESSPIVRKLIVSCTDIKHRNFDDIRYNPDLSILLLETAFARARLEDNDCVSIQNVADAIKNCNSLYKRKRDEFASKLLKLYTSNSKTSDKSTTKCRIIQFPGNLCANANN